MAETTTLTPMIDYSPLVINCISIPIMACLFCIFIEYIYRNSHSKKGWCLILRNFKSIWSTIQDSASPWNVYRPDSLLPLEISYVKCLSFGMLAGSVCSGLELLKSDHIGIKFMIFITECIYDSLRLQARGQLILHQFKILSKRNIIKKSILSGSGLGISTSTIDQALDLNQSRIPKVVNIMTIISIIISLCEFLFGLKLDKYQSLILEGFFILFVILFKMSMLRVFRWYTNSKMLGNGTALRREAFSDGKMGITTNSCYIVIGISCLILEIMYSYNRWMVRLYHIIVEYCIFALSWPAYSRATAKKERPIRDNTCGRLEALCSCTCYENCLLGSV